MGPHGITYRCAYRCAYRSTDGCAYGCAYGCLYEGGYGGACGSVFTARGRQLRPAAIGGRLKVNEQDLDVVVRYEGAVPMVLLLSLLRRDEMNVERKLVRCIFCVCRCTRLRAGCFKAELYLKTRKFK